MNPVRPVKVDTELGPIYVIPNGCRGANVKAPHLTVDGVPLQAAAFLVSGDGVTWDFVQQWTSNSKHLSTAPDALRAITVDGKEADIVMLGKLGSVIRPVVESLAQNNSEIFLEAERRRVNNEIFELELEMQNKREKLQHKEQELADLEARI